MSVEKRNGLVASEWRGSFVRTGDLDAPWAKDANSQQRTADIQVAPEASQTRGSMDMVGKTSGSITVSQGSGDRAGYTFVKQ